MAAICDLCGLSGESCLCGDADKCVGCMYFDHIDGCNLAAPHKCIKED